MHRKQRGRILASNKTFSSLERINNDTKDVKRLSKWLKDEEFDIIHTSADQTSVYARGTLAQFEKSLEVKMVRVTKKGLTYNAAKNAPSLPADVGASVQAIIGLQPFRQAT